MTRINGHAKRNDKADTLSFSVAVILSMLSLFTVSTFSAPIDFETAENVALNHLNGKFGGGGVKIKRASLRKTGAAAPYFVFEKENNGFIIVSADDIAVPILGETDRGVFDKNNMPPALIWLLGTFETQIEEAVKSGATQDEETKILWKQSAQSSSSAAAETSYPLTMLSTTWNQGEPYNLKTPLDGNARSAAGCVAVVMSQIMKYWRHPAYGTGASAAYTTQKSISVPSVSFDVQYDYDNMLNRYPNANSGTTAQRDAVSTLIYHCGVSAKMNYAKSGSGTHSLDALTALTKYFDYDNCIRYLHSVSSGIVVSANDWKELVIGQMENNSPVYYSGMDADSSSGHAFVIDGYNGSADRFHLNWGWNGSYDGFFALTALNPNNGKYQFNSRQDMIINIMPNQNGAPPSQIKISVFDVSATQTAVSANIRAKMNYGADFSGKIGLAVISGDAVVKVLDSANYSISNTYIQRLGLCTVNYKEAKLSRQFGSDIPSGDLNLQVVTKRGAGAWTPVGETRSLFIPKTYSITYNLNGGKYPSAASSQNPASYTSENTPVALMRPTRDNYAFDGWFTDEDFSGEAVDSIPLGDTGDKVFYAKWTFVKTLSVASPDRAVPAVRQYEKTTATAPMNRLTAEFTAGPNPAGRSSDAVNFFRYGSRVESAALSIYDASGNTVSNLRIKDDNALGDIGKRTVGSWDLRDKNGRRVSEGVYLIKGVLKTSGGKRERVSAVVGVK